MTPPAASVLIAALFLEVAYSVGGVSNNWKVPTIFNAKVTGSQKSIGFFIRAKSQLVIVI